ncbi:hypothetical protein [Embleya sp. NPDC059237]|uniref:hypothetical protein n=1 Tax=Embleya sp. NPDC059237 TaxID=3346784 RepID=UPI00369C35C4
MTDGTDAVAADVWTLDRPDGTDRTGAPREMAAPSAEPTKRISRWRSIEGTDHDRSPHGITHAYADLLCGLLCA